MDNSGSSSLLLCQQRSALESGAVNRCIRGSSYRPRSAFKTQHIADILIRDASVVACVFPGGGAIYKISYDLSQVCLKFVVRSTYDSDLKRAEIYLRNIVS